MKKKNKRKIAIVGSYPPPYGGISVHIQRALLYLKQTDCIYDFYEISKNAGYIKSLSSLIKLLFRKYYLVHFHSVDLRVISILLIYGVIGKNMYFQIHGSMLIDKINIEGIKSILIKNLLKFVNVIADNKEIKDFAKKYRAKSVVLIDAFLPPIYRESVYKKFISKYKKLVDKRYIISMVGWFNYFQGKDLYGFDIALETLIKIKEQITKDILLLISVNGIRSKELHLKIKNYIIENNLEKNVLFIYEELPEIWPIYIVSNVFIRPTCTDGSALSVKEAMWFETPVICSDCVPRPEGVILFKDRSSDDLFKKITQVYKCNNRTKNIKDKIKKVSNKKFSYKLFNEIYKLNGRIR